MPLFVVERRLPGITPQMLSSAGIRAKDLLRGNIGRRPRCSLDPQFLPAGVISDSLLL